MENNLDKFENLLAEINSAEPQVQIDAADKLCLFMENDSEKVDFDYLKEKINLLIDKLDSIKIPEVGYKLGETIFEFIWLEKLNKEEEKQLISKLMDLKTLWIFPSYLKNEDFINITGVKDYLERYNLKNSSQQRFNKQAFRTHPNDL